MFRRKRPILAVLFLACFAMLNAQSVTFNVSGTNPRCEADFPNGVPYNGTASVQIIPGATIISVTFQIQYSTNTGGWGIWAPSFTVTPSFAVNQVHYSQSTPGAPVLKITPTNTIRMRAVIRYRIGGGGGEGTLVEVFSSLVQYNYFPAPRYEYRINGQAVLPTLPVIIYACADDPLVNFTVYQVSGTGIRWRLLVFESNSAGAEGQPYGPYANCGWQNGNAPQTINLYNPYNAPQCSTTWQGLNGDYLLVRLIIENDCGSVARDALVQVFPQPSGAQVNFLLRGSPQADGYAASGPNDRSPEGEQNPVTMSVSPSDGVLSWGGTEANPTWVGASQTSLDCSYASFYGALDYWRVDIDYRQGNSWVFAGSYTEVTPDNIWVNIQQVEMSINGAPATAGYFSQNFNNSSTGVLGKIFRVTLTGFGPCNQSASKVGYFRITPTQPWHISDPGNGNVRGGYSEGFSLSLAPNPAADYTQATVHVGDEAEVVLSLYDISGRELTADGLGARAVSKGINTFSIRTQSLPSGVYILQARTPTGAQSCRMVKQ